MDGPAGARTCFIIRSDELAHDTIDGEAVVMDMKHGVYYRLEGAAAVAWQALAAGASAQDLCALLAPRCDGAADALGAAVGKFLAELNAFKLVVSAPEQSAASIQPAPAGAAALTLDSLKIHRFEDLQEMLWVDPIHEVDDTGWPTRPPKS